MKYYLNAIALTLMSDLRLEVIDSIKSKNLPEAVKNELQLSFNGWLDTQTASLYKTGVELPSEATQSTAGQAQNDNIFTA
jgi:hypothetical protein